VAYQFAAVDNKPNRTVTSNYNPPPSRPTQDTPANTPDASNTTTQSQPTQSVPSPSVPTQNLPSPAAPDPYTTTQPDPAPAAPVKPKFATAPQAVLTGLTESECQPVADLYVQAISTNDMAALSQSYDVEEMLRYAFIGTPIPDSEKEDLTKSFKESVLSSSLQINQMRANQGTQFSVLHIIPVGDEMRAIVKMVDGDTLVGYEELFFGKNADNQVVIVDIYSFMHGERDSDDKRSGILEAMAVSPTAVFYGDGPTRSDWEKIRSLKHQYRDNPREALNIYEMLHPDFKKKKEVQVLRAQAASRVDEATFIKVYDEYQKTFPDDPSIDLRSMEFFSQRGKIDKLAETLEHLNTAVHGDPLLEKLLENIQSASPKPKSKKR
jgi:hypothetical protein